MTKSVFRKTAMSFAILLFGLQANMLWAADDPSIKGDLRSHIHKSMNSFIRDQTIDDRLYVFDAVDGKLLKLTFDNLHDGIVKKGDFYVSCADFYDQNKRKIDIDFLVRPSGNGLVTTQALVHSIDGKKRKYHLESM